MYPPRLRNPRDNGSLPIARLALGSSSPTTVAATTEPLTSHDAATVLVPFGFPLPVVDVEGLEVTTVLAEEPPRQFRSVEGSGCPWGRFFGRGSRCELAVTSEVAESSAAALP